MTDRLERIRNLESHPVLNLVYKVLGILAALVAVGGLVVGAILWISGGDAKTATPSPRASVSPGQTVTDPSSGVPTQPPFAAAAAAGDCLDLSNRTISCDISHPYEVYALGSTCGTSKLLSYLGGMEGTDVLSPAVHLTQRSFKAAPACVVGLPAPSTSSARNILDGEAGDVWRRCLIPDLGNREVPCSQPHTAEFIFSAKLKPGQSLDCGSKATAYLGDDISKHFDELSVVSANEGELSQCLIVVLGQNWLLHSVRHLEANAVPVGVR